MFATTLITLGGGQLYKNKKPFTSKEKIIKPLRFLKAFEENSLFIIAYKKLY